MDSIKSAKLRLFSKLVKNVLKKYSGAHALLKIYTCPSPTLVLPLSLFFGSILAKVNDECKINRLQFETWNLVIVKRKTAQKL